MALNSMGLGFTLTARDMASATFRRLGGALTRVQGQARQAGRGISQAMDISRYSAAGLTAGVGILSSTLRVADVAGEFEQGLARVGAISRAGAEDLNQLSDAAIQAGIATQFSPTEAIQGLGELAIRGFTAAESMEALTGVLDLAAGGQIGVAQAAQSVGSALRAFRRDASDASLVTDQLLRITSMTALQANEMSLAIGNVARGAGVTRQGLEEMLPAIGLVRNTGVEASVASSAVSSALIEMSQNAPRFRRIGVEVTRADGTFRDLLDVVLETGQALQERYPNAAQRSAEATRLWGRFGLTAFQGISAQLQSGIRTMTGQILRGDAAITFLRKSMMNAAGAAAEFRERLLSTFRGQVTLLKGTIKTLGVVLGEPFAAVFRPVVKVITDSLNLVIRFFKSIPDWSKVAIAAMIVLGAAFLTLGGAVFFLGVGIALLLPVIQTLAIGLGIAVALVLPLVAAFGALTIAALTVWGAIKLNLGDIGKEFIRLSNTVKLAIRATTEFIRTGGFSEELDRQLGGANEPIRRFALRVGRLWNRVKTFFEGVRFGFQSAMEFAGPAFHRMREAFVDVGRALGIVGEEGLKSLEAITGEELGVKGVRLGEMIGGAIEWIATKLTQAAKVAEGYITAFMEMRSFIEPSIRLLIERGGELRTEFGLLLEQISSLFGSSEAAGDSFTSLGAKMARADVAGLRVMLDGVRSIIGGMQTSIQTVRTFIATITGIRDAIGGIGPWVIETFRSIEESIISAIDSLIVRLGQLAAMIPEQFRPEFVSGIVEAGERAEGRIFIRERVAARRAPVGVGVGGGEAVTPAMAEVGARREGGITGGEIRSAVEAATAAGLRAASGRPIEIVVEVDGETLSKTVMEQQRSSAEAGFSPVGVGA